MKHLEYITFSQAPWEGRRAPDFPLPVQGLDALREMGKTVVDKKNRSVYFLEQGSRRFYAKFLTPRPFSLHNLLECLFRHPQVFRIWDVHCAILSKGHLCARPLLSAIKNDGTQLFVAEEVPWTDAHQFFKENEDSAACLGVVRQLATELVRLHKAHIIHGDFLPGNACLAPDGGIYLLDNDRTAVLRFPPLQHIRHRNVIQFCAHAFMYPSIQEQLTNVFLDTYLKAFPSDNRQKLLDTIAKRMAFLIDDRLRQRMRQAK